MAGNNKTKNHRTPIFDLIFDSQRDNFPFVLNGELVIIDGEPFQIIRL